ncbi:MAG: segregation and condensation protein A [Myxococcota bacterium]
MSAEVDPKAEGPAPSEPTPDPSVPAPSLETAVDSGSVGAASGYAVKLPVFEGPLDLLLHLIRQNEVEVTEIPIAIVSEQYLEYLEIMRELNLDVAGEYLVMAATLALIKSRMLLPPDEDEEAEEAVDPRAELVARLLEYKRYKEVAEELGRLRWLDRDVYAAQGSEPEPVPDSEREIAVGLFQLLEAFRGVLDRASDEGGHVHEVEHEPVTVRERMIAVMEVLDSLESIEFVDLFDRVDGGKPTRTTLVATFLAILELARLTALRIYQGAGEEGAPSGPIRLRPTPIADREQVPDWGERISELM